MRRGTAMTPASTRFEGQLNEYELTVAPTLALGRYEEAAGAASGLRQLAREGWRPLREGSDRRVEAIAGLRQGGGAGQRRQRSADSTNNLNLPVKQNNGGTIWRRPTARHAG